MKASTIIDLFYRLHPMDRIPRAGYLIRGVTETESIAAHSHALATLVMVLGPQKGRALLEDLPGCEGYFVSKHLEVTRTSRFATA